MFVGKGSCGIVGHGPVVVLCAGPSDSMHSRQNGSGFTLSFGRSEQNENKINHSDSLMK